MKAPHVSMDLDRITLAAMGNDETTTVKSVRAALQAVWAAIVACVTSYCSIVLVTSYFSILSLILAGFTLYIVHRQLLVIYTLVRRESGPVTDATAEFSRAGEYVMATMQAKIAYLCNLGTHVIETPPGAGSIWRYYGDKVYGIYVTLKNLVVPGTVVLPGQGNEYVRKTS